MTLVEITSGTGMVVFNGLSRLYGKGVTKKQSAIIVQNQQNILKNDSFIRRTVFLVFCVFLSKEYEARCKFFQRLGRFYSE